MVGDAEHAAGLEHGENGLEHRCLRTVHDPVVHVAEGQHHIDRIRRAQHRCGWIDMAQLGQHVLIRVHRNLGFQLRVQLLRLFACIGFHACGIVEDADVVSVVVQQRREDFGIPAAAGGDLDNGLVGHYAEERERFLRMPVFVARHVVRVAPCTGDRLVERGRVGGWRRFWHRLRVGMCGTCGRQRGDQCECSEGGANTAGLADHGRVLRGCAHASITRAAMHPPLGVVPERAAFADSAR